MSHSTQLSFREAKHGDAPHVLNFGGGVDSTGELVGLVRLFRLGYISARPDLIHFADTGDELPETYANVSRISDWLVANGFPQVTVASRPNDIRGKVGYKSLSENCITNETLPSEAFGRGACASKWKHEPMDAFLFGRKRPLRKGWVEQNFGRQYLVAADEYGRPGARPVKLVGYDATEVCSGKRAKNAKLTAEKVVLNKQGDKVGGDRYDFRYPLVEWGWTRQDCVDAILSEGLPLPIKSACSMCPNQKPEELKAMAAAHPELLLRALAIEEIARRGKHGLRQEGLWRRTRKGDNRSGSWVTWAKQENLLDGLERDAGRTLEELVAELKPEWVPQTV